MAEKNVHQVADWNGVPSNRPGAQAQDSESEFESLDGCCRKLLQYHQKKWCPFVDAYRTLCISANAEVRQIFDELHLSAW